MRADFRNFLFLVWKHLGLPEPTPEQYDIAGYLQHGPKKKMIMAFRGVGKSWIYGAFVAWRGYTNPDWKMMVVSASKQAADSLSMFVKKIIDEMPMLQHLRPREGQKDSVVMFDFGPSRTSKDPSVKSVGITGQITGSRADEIIADDIETTNNSYTAQARERLLELIKEFSAVVKPESGYITYLGTPQSEMSIYNELPGRGYEIRIWPARIPTNPEKYAGRLAPYILKLMANGAMAGDPVSPRFPEHVLREKEAEYGRSGFALQFMLDSSLSDADRYPLKLSDLIVFTLDPRMAPVKFVWAAGPDQVLEDLPNPGMTGDRFHSPMWTAREMAEFTGSVMFIDPSGRGKDETAYAVVKILHGWLYLTASGGALGGYEEGTLNRLAVIAKQHNVNRVLVESNFGDGMFTQLLKPVLARIHPVTVEEVRAKGQKEARIIETLEPLMNQHRLIIDRKVVEDDLRSVEALPVEGAGHYSLFYQLTRLTKERGSLRHDDRLDAVAGACQYWLEHMASDTDKAASDHYNRLMQEELERYMDGVLGAPKAADTWMGNRL
ncbi:phage terminase large subunit [Ancylobacter sp. WKF20]|nr:phage terminase large subunit [Ancylobacter sp. WKF20]WGD32339.1 phage terminase large subunit [Ancylobacter sp. WKF20]